jgi:GT2 family glycosyltransferase
VPYELVLVDNGSHDGTPDYFRELRRTATPNVKLVLNPKNLGFAQGLATRASRRPTATTSVS